MGANRTFYNDPTLTPTLVNYWGVLDHISSFRHEHLQSGVVKITHGPSVSACLDCLINVSVQTDEVAAGAQGEPVKVDPEVPTEGGHHNSEWLPFLGDERHQATPMAAMDAPSTR
jgi:hypothetical protein